MANDTPAPAKITTPRLSRVYLRARLHQQLDHAQQHPLIWMSAPGGFGKTTLVANYLKEREIPHLWYQLDEGDTDIVSFIYYLGLADQHSSADKQQPLPLLTPEYMMAPPVFIRNFFRDLFDRLDKPGVLVLDNYQDVPVDSPLHHLIAEALLEIPADINVIIISRTEPPSQFARLQANQSLIQFDTKKLAFTQGETEGLVQLFGYNDSTPANIKALHNRFNGWCAGIILQLRQGLETNSSDLDLPPTPEPVFEYLAFEVFNRMSTEEQNILLKSALLTQMTTNTLHTLTGSTLSEPLLARLNQQNYFTTLHSQSPPVYQYHALFREFLLKKGRQIFSDEQYQALQSQAASIQLKEGKIEEAAALFEATGDYDSIIEIILKNAPMLTAQGRLQVLQRLICRLSSELQQLPWITYWQACILLAPDLPGARHHYEQALSTFEQENDIEGMFLSWAGIVDTYVIAWDNFQPLDHWIEWMDDKLSDNPVFPSPMVEARVIFGMFCCLMYHQPDHPEMANWASRFDMLLEHLPDDNQRIFMATHYILYLGWMGDLNKACLVLERLRPSATIEKIQPIYLIAWQQAEAMYHWLNTDFRASEHFIQTGLDLAQSSGIHLLDFILLVQRVYTLSDSCTDQEREQHLQKVLAIMDGSGSARQSHYYYIAALDALLRRDPERALVHLEKAIDDMKDIGLPFPYTLYCIAMARVLGELDQFDQAHEFLATASDNAQTMNSSFLKFSIALAYAELAFAQDNETSGLDALSKAMTIGKTHSYFHIDWWRPYAMLDLSLKALQCNIEVDYVQKLVSLRNLIPDSPPLDIDNWPWQIRIYSLGRFSVVLNGKPVNVEGKGRGKPLELLKVLIAMGGREVSEEKITEALWPDADGDVAHSAFTTTLSRLRKLISTDALIIRDGQLSLNDRLCWLDTWAYERMIGDLEQLLVSGTDDIDNIQQHMNKVFSLYKGAFLNKQTQMSWVLAPRERLRLKLLRVIKHLISAFGPLGLCEQVIDLHEKALEIDQLAEEYYRGLMRCHAGQGDRAKALSIYENCHSLFSSTFNIEPSEKTQQLYQTIKADDQAQLSRLCDSCRQS